MSCMDIVFYLNKFEKRYHHIRMKENNWKTILKTKYYLYECLLMPFGLTNACNILYD